MKVMLLMWSTAPPPAALMGHLAHQLLSSGELVSCAQLLNRPPGASPFIAAFWLVDCLGLDRALEIAARIPCHAVEVRPVLRAPGEEM